MQFLTITNFGYLEFAINLMENFQQSYMRGHSLLVECLDRGSWEALENCRYPNVRRAKSASTAFAEFFNYNSDGFRKIIGFKLPLLLSHLRRNGHRLWYTDCDIAYLRDPEPYTHFGCDILTQSDAKKRFNCFGRNQCTGSIIAACNERTCAFLARLIAFHERNGNLNDQEAFAAFLATLKVSDVRGCVDCRLGILSPELFPNGFHAFHTQVALSPAVVAVHANYLVGQDAKRNALLRYGGWFLSVDR